MTGNTGDAPWLGDTLSSISSLPELELRVQVAQSDQAKRVSTQDVSAQPGLSASGCVGETGAQNRQQPAQGHTAGGLQNPESGRLSFLSVCLLPLPGPIEGPEFSGLQGGGTLGWEPGLGLSWEGRFHWAGLGKKLAGWELSTLLRHWREAVRPGTEPTFLPAFP